jgi:hypothetical protein
MKESLFGALRVNPWTLASRRVYTMSRSVGQNMRESLIKVRGVVELIYDSLSPQRKARALARGDIITSEMICLLMNFVVRTKSR